MYSDNNNIKTESKMILSDLRPQHRTNVIGQVLENKASIEYVMECLKNDMQDWEIKEYKAVLNDSKDKLKELRVYLIDNKAHFNDLLSQYKMCVPMFINLEILPHITMY